MNIPRVTRRYEDSLKHYKSMFEADIPLGKYNLYRIFPIEEHPTIKMLFVYTSEVTGESFSFVPSDLFNFYLESDESLNVIEQFEYEYGEEVNFDVKKSFTIITYSVISKEKHELNLRMMRAMGESTDNFLKIPRFIYVDSILEKIS